MTARDGHNARKDAARAIQKANPGMKYKQAQRLADAAYTGELNRQQQWQVPIGVDVDGKPVALDLADLDGPDAAVLVGPTGAGKTTTLMLLGAVLKERGARVIAVDDDREHWPTTWWRYFECVPAQELSSLIDDLAATPQIGTQVQGPPTVILIEGERVLRNYYSSGGHPLPDFHRLRGRNIRIIVSQLYPGRWRYRPPHIARDGWAAAPREVPNLHAAVLIEFDFIEQDDHGTRNIVGRSTDRDDASTEFTRNWLHDMTVARAAHDAAGLGKARDGVYWANSAAAAAAAQAHIAGATIHDAFAAAGMPLPEPGTRVGVGLSAPALGDLAVFRDRYVLMLDDHQVYIDGQVQDLSALTRLDGFVGFAQAPLQPVQVEVIPGTEHYAISGHTMSLPHNVLHDSDESPKVSITDTLEAGRTRRGTGQWNQFTQTLPGEVTPSADAPDSIDPLEFGNS